MWKKLFYLIPFISVWVSAAELECATLTTPVEGSDNSPTSTIVRWTSQPEAIGYEVSIGTSPFENDIVQQKIYTDNFTEQIDFPPNTIIYVIIIPFSNTQFTVGCEQMTFTTAPECEYFINPVMEISLCYTQNDASNFVVIDLEKIEIELIGEQRGLEINYYDSENNVLDLMQLSPNSDETTYAIQAKVKDMDNCVKEISFDLILSKTPEVDVFDDIVACDNYGLPQLSLGNSYYTETDGSGTELQAGQMITNSQKIYVLAEGNFCTNQSSFSVTIDANSCVEQRNGMDYPKFFTPNGDGINDLWRLSESFTSSIEGSPIFIYDRYGNLVCQLDFDSSGWDGKYKGNLLPASDYWFVMHLDENNILKGHFALKR